ncbi:MAG: Dabb family protein [Actinobacteria bacterium]|nr:Dabb family protein [Actinomycetota bacterium]
MAEFDDVAGYELYSDHPAHQKVIQEQIVAELSSRAAAQYTF